MADIDKVLTAAYSMIGDTKYGKNYAKQQQTAKQYLEDAGIPKAYIDSVIGNLVSSKGDINFAKEVIPGVGFTPRYNKITDYEISQINKSAVDEAKAKTSAVSTTKQKTAKAVKPVEITPVKATTDSSTFAADYGKVTKNSLYAMAETERNALVAKAKEILVKDPTNATASSIATWGLSAPAVVTPGATKGEIGSTVQQVSVPSTVPDLSKVTGQPAPGVTFVKTIESGTWAGYKVGSDGYIYNKEGLRTNYKDVTATVAQLNAQKAVDVKGTVDFYKNSNADAQEEQLAAAKKALETDPDNYRAKAIIEAAGEAPEKPSDEKEKETPYKNGEKLTARELQDYWRDADPDMYNNSDLAKLPDEGDVAAAHDKLNYALGITKTVYSYVNGDPKALLDLFTIKPDGTPEYSDEDIAANFGGKIDIKDIQEYRNAYATLYDFKEYGGITDKSLAGLFTAIGDSGGDIDSLLPKEILFDSDVLQTDIPSGNKDAGGGGEDNGDLGDVVTNAFELSENSKQLLYQSIQTGLDALQEAAESMKSGEVLEKFLPKVNKAFLEMDVQLGKYVAAVNSGVANLKLGLEETVNWMAQAKAAPNQARLAYDAQAAEEALKGGRITQQQYNKQMATIQNNVTTGLAQLDIARRSYIADKYMGYSEKAADAIMSARSADYKTKVDMAIKAVDLEAAVQRDMWTFFTQTGVSLGVNLLQITSSTILSAEQQITQAAQFADQMAAAEKNMWSNTLATVLGAGTEAATTAAVTSMLA
ncbi:MAG: hypothetical protein WC449_05460 [Candidatus Paceibacterota bacterium]